MIGKQRFTEILSGPTLLFRFTEHTRNLTCTGGQDGQHWPGRVTGSAHMGAGHRSGAVVTTPEKQAWLAVQFPHVDPLGRLTPDSGSRQLLQTMAQGEARPPGSA